MAAFGASRSSREPGGAEEAHLRTPAECTSIRQWAVLDRCPTSRQPASIELPDVFNAILDVNSTGVA
ncbi:hypothetical protein [Nonomuraea sp. NPDC050643]|uniref:hypothetical protein n=1 Tax=Nonomuraea sp. NPDC050643 TaxID=3155660 RepID=UPI0033CAD8F5